LLVGELDLNGLAAAFEFNGAGHRLVNRACARRLRSFHSPPISSQSVALFQLHRYGLDGVRRGQHRLAQWQSLHGRSRSAAAGGDVQPALVPIKKYCPAKIHPDHVSLAFIRDRQRVQPPPMVFPGQIGPALNH
jgi:hypothetical protein